LCLFRHQIIPEKERKAGIITLFPQKIRQFVEKYISLQIIISKGERLWQG
jgi:hypothetical protein